MTRGEIEEFSVVELNCFETDREEQWYRVGLKEGLKAADAYPKSPWISVEKDLPCNHPELITCESSIYSEITIPVIAVIHNFIIMSRMYKEDGKWYWENDEPTHWMPIPERPKE